MKPTTDVASRDRLERFDWDGIATSARFRHLLAVKKIFIVPAFLFFLFYYLLLPGLLGLAPRLMSARVVGTVTVAYLFALSQFVVGWMIAFLYLKAAARFDQVVEDVIKPEVSEQPDPPTGEQ
jgi:uncharacterized membrane protein (DUF485 family)